MKEVKVRNSIIEVFDTYCKMCELNGASRVRIKGLVNKITPIIGFFENEVKIQEINMLMEFTKNLEDLIKEKEEWIEARHEVTFEAYSDYEEKEVVGKFTIFKVLDGEE